MAFGVSESGKTSCRKSRGIVPRRFIALAPIPERVEREQGQAASGPGSGLGPWVVATLTGFLRLSQAKTLAVFVAAAQRVGRVCLPAIAQCVGGEGTLKHRIKRLWRFTDNCRVEPSDAMRGVIQKLLKKRKKRLLVAFERRRTKEKGDRRAYRQDQTLQDRVCPPFAPLAVQKRAFSS